MAIDDNLWNVETLGKYLNVTRDTIYKWISEKQMPAIRIGKKWLFRKKEIDIWLASSGHIQNQKYFSKEQ